MRPLPFSHARRADLPWTLLGEARAGVYTVFPARREGYWFYEILTDQGWPRKELRVWPGLLFQLDWQGGANLGGGRAAPCHYISESRINVEKKAAELAERYASGPAAVQELYSQIVQLMDDARRAEQTWRPISLRRTSGHAAEIELHCTPEGTELVAYNPVSNETAVLRMEPRKAAGKAKERAS